MAVTACVFKLLRFLYNLTPSCWYYTRFGRQFLLNEVSAEDGAQKRERDGENHSRNGNVINRKISISLSCLLICARVFGPYKQNDRWKRCQDYVFNSTFTE